MKVFTSTVTHVEDWNRESNFLAIFSANLSLFFYLLIDVELSINIDMATICTQQRAFEAFCDGITEKLSDYF